MSMSNNKNRAGKRIPRTSLAGAEKPPQEFLIPEKIGNLLRQAGTEETLHTRSEEKSYLAKRLETNHMIGVSGGRKISAACAY